MYSQKLKREHARFRALDLVLDLDLELFLLTSIQVFYCIRNMVGRLEAPDPGLPSVVRNNTGCLGLRLIFFLFKSELLWDCREIHSRME